MGKSKDKNDSVDVEHWLKEVLVPCKIIGEKTSIFYLKSFLKANERVRELFFNHNQRYVLKSLRNLLPSSVKYL